MHVHAQTGTLYFSPSSTNITVGKTFQVKIITTTGDDEVNSVIASFTYPADLLSVTNISSANSVFNQTQREQDATGTVFLERYSNSFFTGTGEVATITFQSNALGDAPLTFTSDAALLTGYDNPPDALSQAINGVVHILVNDLPRTGIADDYPGLTVASGGILVILGLYISIKNRLALK